VSLEYAFQTEEKLFFVMKFMRGGELFKHLRDQRRFSEQTAKFYAASVVLAFEYLHAMKVVYRDLKPENILMDD
jgi:serum/glucocorticoid-regulated kinase 2